MLYFETSKWNVFALIILGKKIPPFCFPCFDQSPCQWRYFHYSRRWVIEDLVVIYVIEFSAYVSFRSFIVSGLTFRSLIHFVFIFVCGVRKWSNFILLHVTVQFSLHHWLKRLSLPHCIFLSPLSKYKVPIGACGDFPGGSDGKSVCLQCGRPGFNSCVGKIF